MQAGVKPRILVVDDEPEAVELVEFNLKQAGYAVITAVDGAEALKKAHAHRPDLIILDVMLPILSGFEVLSMIRKSSAVPVIMLTAMGDDADRIVGLELGADEFDVFRRIEEAVRGAVQRNEAFAPFDKVKQGFLLFA